MSVLRAALPARLFPGSGRTRLGAEVRLDYYAPMNRQPLYVASRQVTGTCQYALVTLLVCAYGFVGLGACGSSRPSHTSPPATANEAVSAKPAGHTINRQHLQAQLTPYIESFGKGWGDAFRFSGYVLVTHGTDYIYAQGFGYTDRQAKAAGTLDTSFRIGSVTKQFTAAAILALEEEGKLSVADPISKHIPEYPAAGRNITIHQLLTHTSGIPNYTTFSEVMSSREKARTVSELLAAFWDKPLDFAPGSEFRYSNSGYAVLGAIIERASGMSYGDYVQARLFDRARLGRTVYGDAEGDKSRALGYETKGRELVPATPISMSVAYAAGGIRSSAQDLYRWHVALSDGRVLSQTSIAKLYTPEKQGYAYGWVVGEQSGHRTVSHDGGIDGFLTSYIRVPDADLAVIVLANTMSVDPRKIAVAAIHAAFGGTLQPEAEPALIDMDPAVAARVKGRYRLSDKARESAAGMGVPAKVLEDIAEIEIKEVPGGLAVDPSGQEPFQIFPIGPAMFLAKSEGIQVEFQPDGSLRLTQGGLTLEYTRGK